MATPLISIVLPTFNREQYLPRALESIIAQTVDDWEIIVVDDGSTDGTPDLVSDYARRLGDRLLYLQQPNRGASASRNRGINAARGRYVAFLDSDDEFLPGKLERQLALFNARTQLGFVYSDYAYVELDGLRHHSAFDTHSRIAREVPTDAVAPGLFACRGSLFDVLIRGYFIATIVGMVRRDVLGDTLRFPAAHAYAEEWLFYLTVARACAAGFVDEPLSLHHYTDGSLARTDPHRNSVRYGRLLETIDRSFGDLTRAQRRSVHTQLARNRRQLAYDASRVGRHGDAALSFAAAFRYDHRADALAHAANAAVRALLQRMRFRRPLPQDAPTAVR